MDHKKPIIWIGSSKKDFVEFPRDVRTEMGHALYIAQKGDKHRDAKPLKGFGGGSVLEIVQSDGNGTCRTVYTVQMEEAVVVLHAFQKKSKTGIKTPKQDIDLVEQRLKSAHQKYKEWLTTFKKGLIKMATKKKQEDREEIAFEIGGDNIFADIGAANPEEELTKAELAWEIDHIIKKRKLTQEKAAKIMGINQPKVSALLHRKLSGFSVERLMHFLNQLGQDIDIIVRPKPHNRKNGRVNVFGYEGYSAVVTSVPLVAESPKKISLNSNDEIHAD